MIPTGQVPPEFIRGVRRVSRDVRRDEDAVWIIRVVGGLVGMAIFASCLFFVLAFAKGLL